MGREEERGGGKGGREREWEGRKSEGKEGRKKRKRGREGNEKEGGEKMKKRGREEGRRGVCQIVSHFDQWITYSL